MAKRFLLNVLVQKLGEYVEGLTEENLRVGVLSGKIELKNLKLKKSAMDAFDIPVEVSYGVLKSLRVEIPWASLDRKPVKVYIDGILLQLIPIDVKNISKQEIQQKLTRHKRNKLDALDRKIQEDEKLKDNKQPKETNNKTSYTQKLTEKILDNLEVIISNVHIRYEDSSSSPGVTFSAGCILNQFSISTTDWDWNRIFISRDSNINPDESQKIHKLLNIENLSFYWNINTTSIYSYKIEEWEKLLIPSNFHLLNSKNIDKRELIAHSNEFDQNFNNIYILSPPNNILVKLIHAEKATELTPKIDLTLEGFNLEFKITKSQLEQLVLTLNTFYSLERQRLAALYRPVCSVAEDPKSWWKYAYLIISGKRVNFSSKIEEALKCARLKLKYIHLLKLKMQQTTPSEHTEHDTEIDSIETELPLCALIQFRTIAMKEHLKYLKELPVTPEQPKSSWFSWGKKKSTAASSSAVVETNTIEEDEEINIDGLNLEEYNSSDTISDTYSVRLRLKEGSSSLALFNEEHRPVVFGVFSYGVSLDVRSSGVGAVFNVNNLTIIDQVSESQQGPERLGGSGGSGGSGSVPPIIAPRAIDSVGLIRPFLAIYNSRMTRVDIDITSFPLVININTQCIRELISFFSFGVQEDASAMYIKAKLSKLITPYISQAYKSNSEVNFSLDITAPIVIVPDNNFSQPSFLYFDMGHLLINFKTTDGAVFEFDAKASDVNICLTKSRSYTRVDDSEDILTPLCIHFTSESKTKIKANVTSVLSITPNICCVLDQDKFTTILKIMHQVMTLFKPRKVNSNGTTNNNNSSLSKIKKKQIELEYETIVEEEYNLITNDLTNFHDFSLNLPNISLNLNNKDVRDLISIKVEDIDVHYAKRNFDSYCEFKLQSITVTDKYDKKFIHTSISEFDDTTQKDSFISIKLTQITSVRSPLYSSHGAMLYFNLRELGVNFDTSILFILKPYYNAVKIEYANKKSRTEIITKKATRSLNSIIQTTANRRSLNGIMFQTKINCVMLNLLKNDMDTTKFSEFDKLRVEKFYQIKLQNLSSSIDIKKTATVSIELDRFDVIDTRPVSQYYLFRTLLSKTSNNSNNINVNDIGKYDNACSDQNNNTNNFLSLHFFQADTQTSQLEISLEDLTSYISIDALLDLVYLVSSYSLDLKQIFSSDTSKLKSIENNNNNNNNNIENDLQIAIKESESANKANNMRKGSRFYIILKVKDPTLILLEDPLNFESRGIVSRCLISFHFTRQFDEFGDLEKEFAQLKMLDSDVSVFRNINLSSDAVRVLDPCKLEFLFKRDFSKGIMYSSSIALEVNHLNIYMSNSDILLIISILSRGLYVQTSDDDSKTSTTSTSTSTTVNSRSGSSKDKESDKFINVTALEFTGGIGALSFLLYDDISKYSPNKRNTIRRKSSISDSNQFEIASKTPIFNAKIFSIDLLMNGTTESISGKMDINLDINNYNYNNGCWEPIIEKALFVLQIRKSSDAFAVQVLSENPIQINLTCFMMKSFLKTITDIQRLSSTSNNNNFPTSSSSSSSCSQAQSQMTWIENHTGIDITLRGDEAEEGGHESFILHLKGHDFISLEQINKESIPNHSFPGQCMGNLNPDIRSVQLTTLGFAPIHSVPIYINRSVMYLLYSDTGPSQISNYSPKIVWESNFIDGKRKIVIRSKVKFKNYLDYPIVITVTLLNDQDIDLGVLSEEDIIYLPLLLVDEIKCFKLKPLSYDANQCSKSFLFEDYTNKNNNNKYDYFSCSGQDKSCCGIVYSESTSNSTTIIVSYNILLTNALPCLMRYRTITDSEIISEGILLSGRDKKLSYISRSGRSSSSSPSPSSSTTYIQFSVGSLQWSPAVPLDIEAGSVLSEVVELKEFEDNIWSCEKCSEKNPSDLNVCLGCRYPRNLYENLVSISYRAKKIVNISYFHIFSKYAVIDRTGLDLAINFKSLEGHEVFRKTFSNDYKVNEAITKVIGCPLDDLETLPASESLIEDIKFQSSRSYIVTNLLPGTKVFTDRSITWSYIPLHLENSTFISTPCDDKVIKIKNLIEFQIKVPSLVIIFRDASLKSSINWLSDQGFYGILDQLVAKQTKKNKVHDIIYNGYAKYYEGNSKVVLDGNNSFDGGNSMYTVVAIAVSSNSRILEILSQVLVDKNSQHDGYIWMNGGRGITLCNPSAENIRIGISRKKCWSSNISLDSLGTSQYTPFDISDTSTNLIYQLAYKLNNMPGLFRMTKTVNIVPRFCIVNCTKEIIRIKQLGDESPTVAIEPLRSKIWFPYNTNHTNETSSSSSNNFTSVNIRTQSTRWSFAAVDLNEIGISTVLLPKSFEEAAGGNSMHPASIVLNLDVNLASSNQNAYIIITIWKSSIRKDNSPLSIQNTTSKTIGVNQPNIDFTQYIDNPENSTELFTLASLPNTLIPFGWTQVQFKNTIRLSLFDNHAMNYKLLDSLIDFNMVDEEFKLGDGLIARVNLSGHGKVLKIIEEAHSDFEEHTSLTSTNKSKFTCNFKMSNVVCSIYPEMPFRRELLVVTGQDFDFSYILNPTVKIIECKLGNLQIDNFTESSCAPVILYSQKSIDKSFKDLSSESSLASPFFHMSIIQNRSESRIAKYKYIAVLLLEFHVCLDTATLKCVLSDIFEYLRSGMSNVEVAAYSTPYDWIEQYSVDIVSVRSRTEMVNISRAMKSSDSKKIFVDCFIIHPIKAHLTYSQSVFERSSFEDNELMSRYTWLHKLNFISIDDVELKLNAFAVEHAVESVDKLISRLLIKTKIDVMGQLIIIVGSVLGSLDLLGKPVGLVKNIGNGIQDFFYEPASGLMQSPEGFFLGVGKGTTSLLSGIVGGALSSTALIVKSATSTVGQGAALIAGENDRYQRRQSRRASKSSGVLGGFIDGGTSIVSGISSGLTGLITKPMEGVKKEGALGFAKGFGMGILGVAAKPVMGVTEGLSSIAHEISTQLKTKKTAARLKPQRKLYLSKWDSQEAILTTPNK